MLKFSKQEGKKKAKNSSRSSGSYAVSDPRLNEIWGVNDPTESGVDVNEWVALTYSAIYAAVGIISSAMASMPCHVYRRNSGMNGNRDEMTDHPANNILSYSPDGQMTSFGWKETSQMHTCLRGNAVSEIVRNYRGQAMYAHLLDPRRVSFNITDAGKKQYVIGDKTGPKYLEPTSVVHIQAPGWDGWIGKSPITLARETVGLGIATERFGSKFFGSGGRPLGFLTKPNTLTDKQRQTLRQEWEELHGGLRNALNVGILAGGLDWKQVSIAPNDCQFLETRKFQIAEICRWFRIPPHMLAELDGTKIGNTEDMMQYFMTLTLLPWIARWEAELNMKLFTPAETYKYYVSFDMDTLIRADTKTKGEYFERLLRNGLRTITELRNKDNLNSYADGTGNVPLIQANNMATLKDVEDGKTLKSPTTADPNKQSKSDSGE